MAEGVAVEEDIVPDDAALPAREKIETHLLVERPGIEIVGAGQGRADPDRAVVGLQPLADPQQPSDIAIGHDVAGRRAQLRDEVDAVIGVAGERQAPQPLVAQHDARLVLELTAPSLRLADPDELMKVVLDLLGERPRPDDAGVEL